MATTEGKSIEKKSVAEIKAYIELKGLQHTDCYEKSELRERARQASDAAAVEAFLRDRDFIGDDKHWVVGELRGVLDEPCGYLPCGDSKNAFHLRHRFQGFQACYPGVTLDAWVDTLAGLEAYVAFAREAANRPWGQEWPQLHDVLRAISLPEWGGTPWRRVRCLGSCCTGVNSNQFERNGPHLCAHKIHLPALAQPRPAGRLRMPYDGFFGQQGLPHHATGRQKAIWEARRSAA